MVMHFHLHVFDVFTRSIYMFIPICTVLPQAATMFHDIVSLPPPPCQTLEWVQMTRDVVWAPGKLIVSCSLTYLTNCFTYF